MKNRAAARKNSLSICKIGYLCKSFWHLHIVENTANHHPRRIPLLIVIIETTLHVRFFLIVKIESTLSFPDYKNRKRFFLIVKIESTLHVRKTFIREFSSGVLKFSQYFCWQLGFLQKLCW